MDNVTYLRDGNIAIATVECPLVNTLTLGVRRGLCDAIAQAIADTGVEALIIVGGGRSFIVGADIREFGKPYVEPTLYTINDALMASPKPVIAAIHGSALGGGLELALSCQWRVALTTANVGQPEVKLGLMPGAGGTQWWTRLAGPKAALEILTSGNPISAEVALNMGIIDKIVEGDLLAGAIAFAHEVVAGGRPRRDPDGPNNNASTDDPRLFAEFRAKHARKWRGLLAPWKIVDCIEASGRLNFNEGVALEKAAFAECERSPQSKALIHLFFAIREAGKIAGLPADVRTLPVDSVAIIGAGTMGGGIAMAFANAGILVTLVDVSGDALARGMGAIEKNYATSVSRGSTTVQAADRAFGLIVGTTRVEDIVRADLIVEAVFEDMALKLEVFRKLDSLAKPGAILASNTSTLDIDAIAAVTSRPESVVGTHFFSPANVMKLLENIRGSKTSPEVVATVMGLAKRLGKTAVMARNADGFIGNRILAAYGREADFLLEEGATPWQIDRVLQDFGFPMGLFAMRDMAGLDVLRRIRQQGEPSRRKSERYSPIADQICALGRFGQKTGSGYYVYEGRKGVPDPEIEKIVEAVSHQLGITRQPIGNEEILQRLLSAMVNEGARILDEGVAQRASDIDVVYVHGYGFPGHRGGPMFWAGQTGLDKVLQLVLGYRKIHGDIWQPAALLEQLAKTGENWPGSASWQLAPT